MHSVGVMTGSLVYAKLKSLNSVTFTEQASITHINISPSLSNTSSDNILAYCPNYNGIHGHGSTLATCNCL